MKRTLVGLGVVAAVAVLGGAWSSAPAEPREKRPEAGAAAPAKKVSLAKKLHEVIDFPGIDDPRERLIDVLDKFAKNHGVTFSVNERAFKHEMLFDVTEQEVANPHVIPPMKRTLATVLKKVLARLPIPSGATYLVRKEAIEVTTNAFANAEVYPAENTVYNPLDDDKAESGKFVVTTFPRVAASFRKTPLAEALETLAEENDVNIVLDASVAEERMKAPVTMKVRNLPADTAVLMLARMANLHAVQIDNALFVSTLEKAVALKKMHALRRSRRTVEAEDAALLKKEEELTDKIGKKAAGEK
jgi:hypothetical protein